jgi:hypothetical protein
MANTLLLIALLTPSALVVVAIYMTIISPQIKKRGRFVQNSPSRGRSIVSLPNEGRVVCMGGDLMTDDMAELLVYSSDTGNQRIIVREEELRPAVSNIKNLCGQSAPEYVIMGKDEQRNIELSLKRQVVDLTKSNKMLKIELNYLSMNMEVEINKRLESVAKLEEATKKPMKGQQ